MIKNSRREEGRRGKEKWQSVKEISNEGMRSWLYLIINNDWRWNEPVSGASLSAPPSPNASSSASSCYEFMKCVCMCVFMCVQSKWDR